MISQHSEQGIRYGRHKGVLFMISALESHDGTFSVALVSAKGFPSQRVRGGRQYKKIEEAFSVGTEIAMGMIEGRMATGQIAEKVAMA